MLLTRQTILWVYTFIENPEVTHISLSSRRFCKLKWVKFPIFDHRVRIEWPSYWTWREFKLSGTGFLELMDRLLRGKLLLWLLLGKQPKSPQIERAKTSLGRSFFPLIGGPFVCSISKGFTIKDNPKKTLGSSTATYYITNLNLYDKTYSTWCHPATLRNCLLDLGYVKHKLNTEG